MDGGRIREHELDERAGVVERHQLLGVPFAAQVVVAVEVLRGYTERIVLGSQQRVLEAERHPRQRVEVLLVDGRDDVQMLPWPVRQDEVCADAQHATRHQRGQQLMEECVVLHHGFIIVGEEIIGIDGVEPRASPR